MLTTLLAQASPTPTTPTSGSGGGTFTLRPFEQILQQITGFIDALVPVIFAIAFIVFIWGIFQYFIFGGADEEKRKMGRQLAVWGIIGMAIMFSVWGLVRILTGTLETNNTRPNIPTFKGSQVEELPVVHIS